MWECVLSCFKGNPSNLAHFKFQTMFPLQWLATEISFHIFFLLFVPAGFLVVFLASQKVSQGYEGTLNANLQASMFGLPTFLSSSQFVAIWQPQTLSSGTRPQINYTIVFCLIFNVFPEHAGLHNAQGKKKCKHRSHPERFIFWSTNFIRVLCALCHFLVLSFTLKKIICSYLFLGILVLYKPL